jgi:NADPH-dependent F420 reductase
MATTPPAVPQEFPDVFAGKVIGIIGGTGPQGRGLASRFAAAGLEVVLGSRSPERAVAAATDVGRGIGGMSNDDCAAACDIAIVAVPWKSHRDQVVALAAHLDSRIVVDCVNPLAFDRRGPYAVSVAEGSAAEEAQMLLPGSRVVGAFHHLSAPMLLDEEVTLIDADVLVVGDDKAATELVQELANRIPGCRGIYAGRLRNARQVEALTANLIEINRQYGAHSSLRVTDV